MPRYKLILEYDGTPFAGWQQQPGCLSVQGVLEEAVRRFSGEAPAVSAAGRTDAGVHALGQVAHLDLSVSWVPFRLRDAFNFHVRPHPVSVLSVEEVEPDFHARFSACYRSYIYRIVNRYAPLTVQQTRVWRIPAPLNVGHMEEAARLLPGTHDFTSFRASECQAKSPVRTLDFLEIQHMGEEIAIYAKARSFLHHQVRNMVGALAWVGKGKWTVEDFSAAFLGRNRCHGAPTAPACGLYFLEAGYPAEAISRPENVRVS